MANSRPITTTRPGFSVSLGVMTGIAAIGVAAAMNGYRPYGSRGRVDPAAQLRAYLSDHLTGSDAAFAVVDRMRSAALTDSDAQLFQRLYSEFAEERAIVRELLRSLGGSPLRIKRLLGQATGSVLKTAAGGEPGDLALFRTLESLSVGVQGKRCLWRTAQSLEPWLPAPTPKTFLALEAQAINQWDQIERRRLTLAASTFASNGTRSRAWQTSQA